jgi:hypothetical protein
MMYLDILKSAPVYFHFLQYCACLRPLHLMLQRYWSVVTTIILLLIQLYVLLLSLFVFYTFNITF